MPNKRKQSKAEDAFALGSVCKDIERNSLSYVLRKVADDKINSTDAYLNQTMADILQLKKQLTEADKINA